MLKYDLFLIFILFFETIFIIFSRNFTKDIYSKETFVSDFRFSTTRCTHQLSISKICPNANYFYLVFSVQVHLKNNQAGITTIKKKNRDLEVHKKMYVECALHDLIKCPCSQRRSTDLSTTGDNRTGVRDQRDQGRVTRSQKPKRINNVNITRLK